MVREDEVDERVETAGERAEDELHTCGNIWPEEEGVGEDAQRHGVHTGETEEDGDQEAEDINQSQATSPETCHHDNQGESKAAGPGPGLTPQHRPDQDQDTQLRAPGGQDQDRARVLDQAGPRETGEEAEPEDDRGEGCG